MKYKDKNGNWKDIPVKVDFPETIGNLNELSTEVKTDLVSAINEVNEPKEVVLFDGVLMGGNTLNIDISPYKRLLITVVLYNGKSVNTGGSNNMLMLDLTKLEPYMTTYCSGVLVPYMVQTEHQGTMSAYCEVNTEKNSFKAYLGFNGTVYNDSEKYYVSKIIGVK